MGRRKTKHQRKHMASIAAHHQVASIPKRQPNGQARERSDAPQDQRRTCLNMRCRRYGLNETRHNRARVQAPHFAADIGLCIEYVVEREYNGEYDRKSAMSDVARLWSVWDAWTAAERRYSIYVIGSSGNPKGASIQMTPERFEADVSEPVDTRTHEERAADALSACMRWRGYLSKLTGTQWAQLARCRASDGSPNGPSLWRNCKPTAPGEATVAALRALAEVAG